MRLGPSHAIVKQYSAQLRCLRRASRMLTQVEHGDRKNVRWPQEVRGHLDDAYSSGLELAAAASDLLAIGARRRGR
jgi:hypothetical protein